MLKYDFLIDVNWKRVFFQLKKFVRQVLEVNGLTKSEVIYEKFLNKQVSNVGKWQELNQS